MLRASFGNDKQKGADEPVLRQRQMRGLPAGMASDKATANYRDSEPESAQNDGAGGSEGEEEGSAAGIIGMRGGIIGMLWRYRVERGLGMYI